MSLPVDQRSASVKIHEVEFLRRYWTALQCNVLSFEINKLFKISNSVAQYTYIALPTDLPVMSLKPTGVFKKLFTAFTFFIISF